MKREQNGKSPFKWVLMLFAAVVVAGISWGLSQGTAPTPQGSASPVFTPAHSSVGVAFKHFFGIRPEPVQPLAYTHTVHVVKVKMECTSCHEGADKGPVAMIPNVTKCMGCHEFMKADTPVLQQLAEYQRKGLDIPWQRVYGFPEESHVRFNHAPHIRAKVDCVTCHGDVSQMTVAERVVDHSMRSFCMKCHFERKVSNDCLTCHY